jgi:hypothetical protein
MLVKFGRMMRIERLEFRNAEDPILARLDRKSVVKGKSVELGGRRIIKKNTRLAGRMMLVRPEFRNAEDPILASCEVLSNVTLLRLLQS